MPRGHRWSHFRHQTLASLPVLPIAPRSNLEKFRCVAGHASDHRREATNVTSQCNTELHEVTADGGAYSLAMHCLSHDHRTAKWVHPPKQTGQSQCHTPLESHLFV